MPVCLVTGEHDRTYVEMAERFTAHCPCAVHYPVPGAWHRVHEDRPGEFREIIEEFWSKTDRQRRKTDESACA